MPPVSRMVGMTVIPQVNEMVGKSDHYTTGLQNGRFKSITTQRSDLPPYR